MVAKSADNNDDGNYESLAPGMERIKRNSKYLSNREKQQMDEIYFISGRVCYLSSISQKQKPLEWRWIVTMQYIFL